MGSVVSIGRVRPVKGQWRKVAKPQPVPESSAPLIAFIASFLFAALAMSTAVVITASKSWADVLPLISVLFVIALTKIILADALFYVMMRSDSEAEAIHAARAAAAPGFVLRRPLPPTFSRTLKRPVPKTRLHGRISTAKVTILARKPGRGTQPPNP
jgi:hypothetical protein